MSGAEVFGAIGSTITIIDAAVKIYKNARAGDGRPLAFREVALRLPVALDTFTTVETNINESGLGGDACRSILDIIEESRGRAKTLEGIIAKVTPQPATSRLDRHRMAFRALRKGRQVERLMHDILTDVQLLANHQTVKAASGEHLRKLLESIAELPGIRTNKGDPRSDDIYHAHWTTLARLIDLCLSGFVPNA